MNEASAISESNWLWGFVWAFYAFFYSRYFAHMARRHKPDLKNVELQGSPERLRDKSLWSKRFGLFMLIPSSLELIRPTDAMASLINLAPCLFGLWVMRAVWMEVFRSKMPKPEGSKANLR